MKIVCIRINITLSIAYGKSKQFSHNTTETSFIGLSGKLLDFGGEGRNPNAGASASHATTSNQNTSTQNSNSNSNSNPRAVLRPSWMTSLPSGNYAAFKL